MDFVKDLLESPGSGSGPSCSLEGPLPNKLEDPSLKPRPAFLLQLQPSPPPPPKKGEWALCAAPFGHELPESSHIFQRKSEAWGPPQFQEKRSRSEKAILGALGEFQGILGATLGIQNSILGIRNSIHTKPAILGATPGVYPGIDGNPHEIFSFAHEFSERFFKNWGGPRTPDKKN